VRHIVIGTAGHIDHGKTALVRALTGIDTDRLEEEKRRGISIDLGFAHLDLKPDLRAAFVDVPGHERFVRNMLAGVSGIDMVLLVIGADESIKPQTREHFDIARLLGIRHGIVVLTKADLVDQDILELVELEASEFVSGSFLEGAPVVAVSAVTGEGLGKLKALIIEMAARVDARGVQSHLRLPVDRAFAMRGFGAVVTGTVASGSISVEQEVAAQPGGLKLRVRGIQVHGRAEKRATAGQRAAVNLTGAECEHLPRGTVLTVPDLFEPVARIGCRLDLLASAKPLKHRSPVHFHSGTSEVEAEVRLLDDSETVRPGSSAHVLIVLKEPVLLLPGDRFIIRMFSPVITIGGGQVIDLLDNVLLRRAALLDRISALEKTTDRVGFLVRRTEWGASIRELMASTGLTEAEVNRQAKDPELLLIEEPQRRVLYRPSLGAHATKVNELVAAFHKAHPLQPGISKEELRSREFAEAPAFYFDLVLKHSPGLVAEGETVRLASHKLHFKQDEAAALSKMEALFEQAGLAVPATADVLAGSGVEPARARTLLQILLREGRLTRVSQDLVFHRTAVEKLKTLMAARRGQRFAVPEFKDWTGISRKYAIPLLEFLDRERITRREGDARVVL